MFLSYIKHRPMKILRVIEFWNRKKIRIAFNVVDIISPSLRKYST